MAAFAEKNRIAFNNVAADYHGPEMEPLLTFLAENLKKRMEWLGINWNADVKVLDYACGGGVMSRVLAPYASKLVGIDISENMITEYNNFATVQNLPPHIMHAYHGTLIDPADPHPLHFSSPEFTDFDLVVVSMALHHFADPAYSLQKLAERVKPGGVLLVVDNTDKAGGLAHKHAMEGTISKSGFTREETKEMFEQAGLEVELFGYEELEEGPRVAFKGSSWVVRIFFAKCKKA